MDKGIYCLVFRNTACSLQIGALGDIAFDAGWHIYIGSALGSGGLKRLERHIRLSKECDRNPKWHIDYLLIDPCFTLTFAVFAMTGEKLECPLVQLLGGANIRGFGCSDCRCPSHLMYRNNDPRDEITAAYKRLGLSPAIKTIISKKAEAII